MKELLKKLVSIKSYSGEEKELADFIISFFVKKGAELSIVNGNILVKIGNNSGKAIIFNAHMDTVKVQNMTKWKTDPFNLTEKDGKYFGLGVSDEKASIAILMGLYDEFVKIKQDIDIFLMFVVNEEVDGSGSKNLAEFFIRKYNYSKAHCVICEPRNASILGMGNKGNIFFEIVADGVSCHSSQPETGHNAILEIYHKARLLKKNFIRFKEPNPTLGKSTLAFPTIIAGGSTVNTIPDKCIAQGDIRTIPETHEGILGFLRGFDKSVRIISATRPYQLDDNTPMVKAFEDLGIKKKQYTTGSNDAVFFGQLGIPALVFGAGNEECIHQANEYVEIGNIGKTERLYLEITKKIGSANY